MSESPTLAEHDLEDSWLWHFGGRRKGSEFELTCLEGHSVASIEMFWRSFHAMPSMISLRAKKMNLYLFKSRVKQPLMEDPLNVGGGRWVVEHVHMQNESDDPYKQTWMEACMFVIGNDMPDRLYASLNGIVCNYQAFSRKFRFELWIAPGLSRPEMKELEARFVAALEKQGTRLNKLTLQYKPHN